MGSFCFGRPSKTGLIPRRMTEPCIAVAIERVFRRLKGLRRIFSQLRKLDVIYLSFIHFTLIVEAFRQR